MKNVNKAYKKWAENYDLHSKDNPAVQMNKHLVLSMLKIKKKDKVLDLGCGTGQWILPIAKKCKKVVGLDASKEMLEIAQSKVIGKKNVRLIKHDLRRKFPFSKGSFDKVFSLLVVSHIKNLDKFASEAHRVLKKGGVFVYNDFAAEKKIPFKLKYKDPLKEMKEQGRQVTLCRTLNEHVNALHKAGFKIEKVEFTVVDHKIKRFMTPSAYKKNKGRTLSVIFRARKS